MGYYTCKTTNGFMEVLCKHQEIIIVRDQCDGIKRLPKYNNQQPSAITCINQEISEADTLCQVNFNVFSNDRTNLTECNQYRFLFSFFNPPLKVRLVTNTLVLLYIFFVVVGVDN